MDITLIFGLLGGLALFLYGMQMMSDGLENAAGDRMERILEKLTSNRFLGVAVGAVITAVLASIGTNRSAKRTTVIHLMFNIIGTVVFTILCLSFPIAEFVGGFTPDKPAAQLANMHTTFNIATTLLLIPFGTLLAKAATKILPDAPEEAKNASLLGELNKEFGRTRTQLGADAIHMDLLRHEIERMITLADENVEKCFNAVLNNDIVLLKEAAETEKMIDTLNKDISQYISKILVNSNNWSNVTSFEQYFLITGNAERIGDHAMNIAQARVRIEP